MRPALSAETELRRRIASRGPITFAEFMEVALYHPGAGYYTSGDRVGAKGDFYTSPSVHPAFGSLLAVQLFQMWETMGRPAPFTLAEVGAGNGLLCRDIVVAASGLNTGLNTGWNTGLNTGLNTDFARSLRYVCVDQGLAPGLERGVPGGHRVASHGMPLRGIVGCILSNELLDAMPVHQVTVEEGSLREVYVTQDGGGLALQTGEPSTPLLAARLESVGINLAEGQTGEVNLQMDTWADDVSRALARGFVLTIDYGRRAEDLYSATERFRGALTTYRDHLQTDRPMEHIGQQDMSSQVDFTALAMAGAKAGLDLLGYTTQAEFLGNLGLDAILPGPLGAPRRQWQSARMGMRELVRPGEMGDFKVMAHGKNVGQPELWGFHGSGEAAAIVRGMPTPLPTSEHIDLAAGRYPAAEVEFEMSWDSLWPGAEAAQ